MIVELFKAVNADMVYVNTDHVVTVRVIKGTADGKNEITVSMDNGEVYTVTEDVLPDGELGPDGLRVLAKLAPEEFTEKFLRVQTQRAKRGLES